MTDPNMLTYYKSIWISDLHLGTPATAALQLLKFLNKVRSDNLYLLGDIIDILALKRQWAFYFPASHFDIIKKIMKRARKGTNVIYLPGNHDEIVRFMREEFDKIDDEDLETLKQFNEKHGKLIENLDEEDYTIFHHKYGDALGVDFSPKKLKFGEVVVENTYIHKTVDGKKILMLHGDQFDFVIQNYKLLTYVGDWGYGILLKMNRYLNKIRSWFNMPYWSLANFAKKRVKEYIKFKFKYEEVIVKYAKEKGCDAVISGHTHQPEIKFIEDFPYYNTGDWVENCTAIVEHYDGTIELLKVGRH